MQQPAPPVPSGPVPPGGETEFQSFLLDELGAIVSAAVTPILNTGLDLWAGLATIVIVWTGLRMAFSGDLRMWDVVELVITISLVRGMLLWYQSDVPLVGLSFPEIVVGMGQWVHQQLYAPTMNELLTAITSRAQRVVTRLDLTGGMGLSTNLTDLLFNFGLWMDAVIDTLMSVGLVLVIYMFFALVMLITMAQVVWAQVAITITVLLGPIFIPFLLFNPLAFLFWGWLRTAIVYSMYAAVAAAISRIFVLVGLRLLDRLTMETAVMTGWEDYFNGLLLALPFLVACLLASLKIGELSAMLISGAGGVSSGAGRLAGAAAGASMLKR